MSQDTILEQAMSLSLDERRRLVKRLAWSMNMSAEPAVVSLDPASPKIFTVAGGLGLLAGVGLLGLGLLLYFIPCSFMPTGMAVLGAGAVFVLFSGFVFHLGLELWSDLDKLAEAEL